MKIALKSVIFYIIIMVEESIEEIKKLPSRERLEKLREYEKKRKEELEEAERLIKQSSEEVRREDVVDKIEVPEQKKIDINDLFESDDKSLEAVIGREAPEKLDDDTIKYELSLDYQLIAKQLVTGAPDYQMQRTAQRVEERINEMLEKFDYANMSKDVANQLVATKSVLYQMKKKTGM